MSNTRDLRISFEFFPPKTDKMEETLWRSVQHLEPLEPTFVSVTYGADGSTRDRTHNVVSRVLRETNLIPAAHLTCVGATREEIDDVARRYWEAGVRHIVALRGDPPAGATSYKPHPGGYAYATDLVAGLKRIADFEISVAAYPESHPEAPDPRFDLDNLKRKLDAGANRAITQFFFDPDCYLRFRDRCTDAGIDVNIVAGILPVTNFSRLKSFSSACGATVPDWLCERFEGLDDDPTTRQLIAANTAIEQVNRLYEHGVRDFHFYTLNRYELTKAICHMLGVRPTSKTVESADVATG